MTTLDLEAIGQWLRVVIREPLVQVFVIIGLTSAFIALMIFERRTTYSRKIWNIGNSDAWLGAFYACICARTVIEPILGDATTYPLTILTSVVAGKAIRVIAIKLGRTPGRMAFTVTLAALLVCIGAILFWGIPRPPLEAISKYHNIHRYQGIFRDPNICGLVAGASVLVTFALGAVIYSKGDLLGKVRKVVSEVIVWTAATVSFLALLMSFSRGAWLGTFVGFAFLAWQVWGQLRCPNCRAQVNASWPVWPRWWVMLLTGWFRMSRWWNASLVAMLVIGIWCSKETTNPFIARGRSVVNDYDFSWKNRIAAWEDMTRMIGSRPFFGFGWEDAGRTYTVDFKADRITEAGVFFTNDMLVIGTSAGCITLVCALGYIVTGLSTRGRYFNGDKASDILLDSWKAAGIVVLVGTWFDGALGNLTTAVLFWASIEIGRGVVSKVSEQSANEDATVKEPKVSGVVVRNGKGLWVCGILCITATVLTLWHLLVPRLEYSSPMAGVVLPHFVSKSELTEIRFLASGLAGKELTIGDAVAEVHLALYCRSLVNWTIGDDVFNESVLNPCFRGNVGERLGWRRQLWEYYFPRIRKMSDYHTAAEMVRADLVARIGIVEVNGPRRGVIEVWRRRRATPKEFEYLCVAVYRSICIPAYLSSAGKALIVTNAPGED